MKHEPEGLTPPEPDVWCLGDRRVTYITDSGGQMCANTYEFFTSKDDLENRIRSTAYTATERVLKDRKVWHFEIGGWQEYVVADPTTLRVIGGPKND